jgi:hypothetical protein
MYTLRTFTETSEVNNLLGDQYEIVKREEQYERFCELFEIYFDKPHLADLSPSADEVTQRCYAFVFNEKKEPMPVYKNQRNYIMTDSGKTFSNITYK